MNSQERNDLINYRINRAKDTLLEVELLMTNQLWSTAINRLYYACYYAISGLLIQRRIQAETHKGTRIMFGVHIVKTGLISRELGRFFTDLFNKRHASDYDDFIEITQKDAISYFEPAQELISEIEKIINSYPEQTIISSE